MDSDKISQEDNILIELHKSRIDNARGEMELRETQMRLLVMSLFKKYGLNDDDQISNDGTIIRADEGDNRG